MLRKRLCRRVRSPPPQQTANGSMVTKRVERLVAKLAFLNLIAKRNAQPAAKHGNEQRWLVVQLRLLARRGLKEQSRPVGREKFEVSTLGLAGNSRARKQAKSPGVDGLTQLLLRYIGAVVGKLAVIVHAAVERIESKMLRRQTGRIRRLK